MSTIIIAIVIAAAVVAFLVMRARQNKDAVEDKKSKTTANKKSTKAVEAKPAAESKAAPKIDLANLITQLDLLIADKEYAKAEASINLNLKQDPSLHTLYLKLAEIYHAQEDDFAIKQLLDTLQKLNLNEIYQTVFNEHEAFKAEQEKRLAVEKSQKTPDVFEFTPSSTTTVDNTSSFDSLANTNEQTAPQDNSLDFASLSVEAPVSTNNQTSAQENSLSFESTTVAETEKAAAPALDFNIEVPAAEPTPATETSTLEFNLDTPAPTPTAEPTLEFKLDTATTDTTAPSQSLDFNLDVPTAPQATETSSLDFKLDVPTQETKAEPSFSFNLDTPQTAAVETPAPILDLAPEPIVVEPISTVQPEPQIPAPESTPSSQYADLNDPIAQNFTALAETNPIDLDLELAEQYIRLGAKEAAQNLLAQHTELSAEQAAKADALRQKIA